MTAIRPPIAPEEIDLLLRQLPEVPDPDDESLLDEQERARATALTSTRDRARFVGGRAALRRVLADRLATEPGRIALGRAACPRCGSPRHGPPRLLGPAVPLWFSMARAAGTALFAVSRSLPVGVDIEVVRPRAFASLARGALSARESTRLAALPDSVRTPAWYRYWCRKEAVLKAAGVGLVVDLAGLDTSRADAVELRLGADLTRWRVADVALPPPLIGAVAWPWGRPARPKLHGPSGPGRERACVR